MAELIGERAAVTPRRPRVGERAPKLSGPPPLSLRLRCGALSAYLRTRPRRVSAMVRVRNEEEFLQPAIESIVDEVDEVVLFDNLSSDGTPEIIRRLTRAHPRKVRAFHYPYEIRRVGRENWELAENPATRGSPHLSATFFNWCLRRCREPFTLKWDADMIAVPALREALVEWRASGLPILMMQGQNVHPDGHHLITARTSDREELLRALSVPGLPQWVTSLTHDYPEPRLVPRAGTRYDNAQYWTQRLSSPFFDSRVRDRYCIRARDACYLHLKFCKRDPCSNYSPDLANVILSNVAIGSPLTGVARETLRERGIRLGDSVGGGVTEDGAAPAPAHPAAQDGDAA